MVTVTSCPDEADLLPLAAEEPAGADVERHVKECRFCSERVQNLKRELESLKAMAPRLPQGWTSPPVKTTTIVNPQARIDIKLPSMIGRYIALSLLGEGGQAMVFRGIHPLLHREVVVKLGKQPVTDPAMQSRLVQEGQTLANLDHPHLAKIHDLDFHEGHPFLVMDFFQGKNLAQYAENRNLSPREIAGIGSRICRAVEAAHERGIVHKDLKPQNIVVDAQGGPHVIDFGMAQVRDAWSSIPDPSEFTGGTPAYIAPERLIGEDGTGQSGDVFGLGGILYFLLAGKAPFEAESTQAALNLAAKCKFDREPLERSGVPRPLAATCLKALEADPARRYASAGEMAQALERYAKPRRVLWWTGGFCAALAILWLLGGALWGEKPKASSSPAITSPDFSVTVRNKGNTQELLGPTALEAAVRNGQRLQISGHVPPGYQVALFLFTADGKLQPLADPDVQKSDGSWEITYPKTGQDLIVEGQPGTDVLVICGSQSELATRKIASHFEGASPWPDLPSFSSVQFDSERSWITGSRSYLTRSAPEKPALDRAESLRQSLANEFEYIRGVAFPHVEETQN